MSNTGVFPCYKNQFQVGAVGAAQLNNIADIEEFSAAINNGVEEWTPFEEEGWSRRLMTSKNIQIDVKGKRNVGDTGNDFIASLAFKNGTEAQCDFTWTFPDGTVVKFSNAIVSVTNLGVGASTNVAPLEFSIFSNGKPTVTLPNTQTPAEQGG